MDDGRRILAIGFCAFCNVPLVEGAHTCVHLHQERVLFCGDHCASRFSSIPQTMRSMPHW